MLKKMIFIFLITFTNVFAQDHVSVLIDSLTLNISTSKKSRIGQKIAWELRTQDWERSQYYLEYSKKNAIDSKSKDLLAEYYEKTADIYYEKEVFDIALNYYQKAYNIYLSSSNTSRIIDLENDLAIIYARMNNKDKALHFFNKIYTYRKQKNQQLALAHVLNNIGTLYLDKNIDSTEIYYLKSLQIAKNINNKELNTYLYTNLGRVYSSKNDLEKAKKYVAKSLAMANTDIKNQTKSWIYKTASHYYLNLGKNDSAIYYATKSKDLLKNNEFSFSNRDAVYALYKSYRANKDYKNATKYIEIYNIIKDSLHIERKAVNIERFKLEQEFHSKNKVQLLKEKQKKYWYLIIGLSLILGLLFVLSILKRYKSKLIKLELEKKVKIAKNSELKATIELKNNELIAKTMSEIHRTEIIDDILSELKQIKLNASKKGTQHAIDLVIGRLKKDSNTDIWKEFELSFKQVHKAFYSNLNEKHPDLTTFDRRLSALLLLNLTSKEISQITGQSFKSIENARTRLRKKLELTNTNTNLASYLNNFNQTL